MVSVMPNFSAASSLPIGVALTLYEQSLAPDHPGRLLWDDVFQRLRTFWCDRPLSDVQTSNINQYKKFYRNIDPAYIKGDLEVLSAAMFSVFLSNIEIDVSKASGA